MELHSKKVILFLAIFLISLSFVSAGFGYDNPTLPNIEEEQIITYRNITDTNSSDFWDNLNTPADILGSWINNDLGWINWAKVINGTLALNSSLSNYLLNTGDTATGNYTFDTDTFFIDAVNNRVGIGTSSPEVGLHIYNTGQTLGTELIIQETTSTKRPAFFLKNDLNQRAGFFFYGSDYSSYANDLRIHMDNTAADIHFTSMDGVGINMGDLDLPAKLSVKTSGTKDILNLFETGWVEVFTVLESGLVGINTTSPLRMLDVVGDIELSGGIYGKSTDWTYYTIDDDYSHKFYTRTDTGASTERFRIEGGAVTSDILMLNSNVGINTTSPGASLHVSSSDINVATFERSDSFNVPLRFKNTISSMYIGLNSAEDFAIGTTTDLTTSAQVTVGRETGNVGINTTTPQNTLNVIGDGNFTGNLIVGGNQTLGQKITFTLGEIIDNIVDGWLTITGNLNVTGNVTAENVFLPSYVSSHTNNTIAVSGAGVWMNVTFDHGEDEFKKRITHNPDNATNHTFTLIDTGIYEITYTMSFEDSAVVPNSHIVTRITRNNVELNGFTIETDLGIQNTEDSLHHSDLVELTTGDKIVLSFTSDDTTVSLSSHLTYGIHRNTGHLTIKRIA